MRQLFNLDICIRPCHTYKGNPLNFIRRGAQGEIEEPEVDVVIFRQNTEGLYCGVEWSYPDGLYTRLCELIKTLWKTLAMFPWGDRGINRIFTRKATERILRAAFEHAAKHSYKSVTLCEKPNVIRETSGMMYNMAKQIQKEYPGIELWNTNIDAQMMWLTKILRIMAWLWPVICLVISCRMDLQVWSVALALLQCQPGKERRRIWAYSWFSAQICWLSGFDC